MITTYSTYVTYVSLLSWQEAVLKFLVTKIVIYDICFTFYNIFIIYCKTNTIVNQNVTNISFVLPNWYWYVINQSFVQIPSLLKNPKTLLTFFKNEMNSFDSEIILIAN